MVRMIILGRMKEESKIIHSIDDEGDREEEQECGSKEKKEEDDSRGEKQINTSRARLSCVCPAD
jgi:hypothetical protein